jgi:DNA-binding NarL/FixJ family response regulator
MIWSVNMFEERPEAVFLKTLNVLYVEDERVTREKISALLRRRVGNLALAGDGVEGLDAFKSHPASLVITDIQMPRLDGLAMAKEIRRRDPSVMIVVTTAFEQPDYLGQAISIGIAHYVTKPIQLERFEFALLSCAHRLQSAGSPQAGSTLAGEEREKLEQLTSREREVLASVGRGLASHEIGQLLGISPRTVNTHLANIMGKVGMHKSNALAAFAVRAGLL